MKKILVLALAATGLISTTSCNKRDFKILKDYLIEMPTYKKVDYEYASEWFKVNPFGMGGCSAIAKDIGTANAPHLIVGRNMDYGFSKKCAYVVRTEEEGEYKTLGIAYATTKASPDFNKLKSNGISNEWRKLIPFFCTDIINEHGLYCEIDMRNVERNDEGKSIFHCDGTNKNAPIDVHMVAVTRFIVNHCKDVEEAEAYVRDKINVFNNENDWNFSFLLADAKGNYGLLEFGDNQVTFEKRDCQTNYFLNNPFGPTEAGVDRMSKNHFGIGRYKFLTENLYTVTDASTMFNLINSVRYSNVYEGIGCPFDMRSETYGLILKDKEFSYIVDDANRIEVYGEIAKLQKTLNEMTEAEREKLPWYWQSTFTNVIDIPSRTIHTRMFENENYVFDFKLS